MRSAGISLLDSLLSINESGKKLDVILNAIEEQQTLTSKPAGKFKDVVSCINSKLNTQGERHVGILLLKTIVTQCPDDVFVDNSVSWMLQIMYGVESNQKKDDAFQVLGMLLDYSRKFPELTKPVSAKIVVKLLHQIIKGKASVSSLKCLYLLLKYYSGPCKQNQDAIKNFLIQLADVENETLIRCASVCWCYVPFLESKDTDTWNAVFLDLCATASSLMSDLFSNVHELVFPTALASLSSGFSMKEITSKDIVLNVSSVGNRLINMLSFIEGMIDGDAAFPKAINGEVVIALAFRGLSITNDIVSQSGMIENVAVMSLLPDVHIALFNLLRTFVSSCNAGILKYGYLFCKFVVQTLNWTGVPWTCGLERPYRNLRKTACLFLESWAVRAKAGSCAEHFEEELINLLLSEVLQRKQIVSLQISERKKGKKAKNELQENVQDSSGQKLLTSQRANSAQCSAALRALCALIQASGSLFSASVHLKLQEVVVSLLLEIRRTSKPEEMPVPFMVPECRLQLYRLLLCLSVHPNAKWPPPIQFALRIFPWGQKDSSLDVASFCTLAMASVRQIAHPSRASPHFPISMEDMRVAAGLSEKPEVNLNDQHSIGEEMETDLNIREKSHTPKRKSLVSSNRTSITNSSTVNDLNSQTSSNLFNLKEVENHTPKSLRKNKRKTLSPFVERTIDSNGTTTVAPGSDKPRKRKRLSEISVDGTPGIMAHRLSGEGWEVVDISGKLKDREKEWKEGSSQVENSDTGPRGKKTKKLDTEMNMSKVVGIKNEKPSPKKQLINPFVEEDIVTTPRKSPTENSASATRSPNKQLVHTFVEENIVKTSPESKATPWKSPIKNNSSATRSPVVVEKPCSSSQLLNTPKHLGVSLDTCEKKDTGLPSETMDEAQIQENLEKVRSQEKMEVKTQKGIEKAQTQKSIKEAQSQKEIEVQTRDEMETPQTREEKEEAQAQEFIEVQTREDITEIIEEAPTPEVEEASKREEMQEASTQEEIEEASTHEEMEEAPTREEIEEVPTKEKIEEAQTQEKIVEEVTNVPDGTSKIIMEENVVENTEESERERSNLKDNEIDVAETLATGGKSKNCVEAEDEVQHVPDLKILSNPVVSPKKSSHLISRAACNTSSPLPRSPQTPEKQNIVTADTCNLSPIIEFSPTSNSEYEKQSKKISIKNLQDSTVECVNIEELPSPDDDSLTKEQLSEMKLEAVEHSNVTPVVDLVDTDNSHSIISINSDRDCVEIEEVVPESKDCVSIGEAKDDLAGDVNTGIGAVAESPDISLEGSSTPPADDTKNILEEGTVVDSKDTDAEEEEMMKTFVDVVSPKSV